MKNEGRFAQLAAGVFWAISCTLMVVATVVYGGPLLLAAWALLCALWACVWTGWALLLRERHRFDTICRLVEAADVEDGLHSV